MCEMGKLFSPAFQTGPLFAILSFSLIFLSASSQNAGKKICQTKECLQAAQNLIESMNTSVNPCDDFYQYACGNFPEVHKNLDDYQSTFTIIQKENDAYINEFFKKNNTNNESEAIHKARKLYTSCLSTAFYGNKIEPLEVILQQIGLPVLSFSLPPTDFIDFDIASALAKAGRIAGVKPYFDIGITQNPYNRIVNMIGLSIPLKESDPNIMPSAREADADYMCEAITRMCKDSVSTYCKRWISTYSSNSIRNRKYRRWGSTYTFESIPSSTCEFTANHANTAALIMQKPRPTFNASTPVDIYTLKQLQDLSDSIANEVETNIPKFNWTKYIEGTFAGLDNVTLDLSDCGVEGSLFLMRHDPNKVPIAIEPLDFIKDMLEFIYRIRTVKEIELGIWWSVVSTLLPYTDEKILANTVSTREERCSKIVAKSFNMAISYEYGTKEKYIKANTQIRKMIENIRESFAQIIQQVPWMDETTKQKALKKLQSLRSYVVSPNLTKTELDDFYRDVQIKSNFFDTMVSQIQKQIAEHLNELNQVNDLEENAWEISPTKVDALYERSFNMIFVLPGILGGSIYNGSLKALDYGAIGTIIGHEMTHAFDNIGRRYNDIGNIEDWWQPETVKLYREKAKCFVKAYANYTTTLKNITQKVHSKATLGEDISDNGGFKESLFGYRRCISASGEEPLLPQFENFTHEQLFTLSFANVWCENPTSDSNYMNEFDEHSPNGVRVNGVLKNSKEFPEIWNCPRGSKMNPIEDKCSIW